MASISQPKPNINKSTLNSWLLATRPKTLLVSLPPIIVGTALAARDVEAINWLLVLSALFCSFGIQIGTNLINDAIDFKKGADAPGRLGPKRVTQEGIFTYNQVLKAGYISFGLALIFGIPLMIAGGWPLLGVLFFSVLCGYCYTGGPYPLAYTGMGDLFVLIFFGWVSTETVYYLQTGTVSLNTFVAATQIGFLATVPLAINNLRDHVTDARVNKNTLAVRLGPQFARWEITLLSLIPFVLGMIWILNGNIWMALLPLLSLPLILINLQSIWTTQPSPLYTQFLAKSALCQLVFGFLLALGTLVG